MWFEALTGFPEVSRESVHDNLRLDGEYLTSKVNGRTYRCGRLELPTLGELRARVAALPTTASSALSVHECVDDAQALHREAANAGALFQVASQFNLLEMISPDATPEQGIDRYASDPTQGPACAVAAGAGTIYRNYFVPLNGQIGQSAARQIDCLRDIGDALGNTDNRLWTMRNGYALASEQGLIEIAERLRQADDEELHRLRALLRIGVQWDTEVTIAPSRHPVTQAYCSALPIGYSEHGPALWEPFARLVLEATYEATLCCGMLNAAATGNDRVFLTKIGGGVFANPMSWIADAIERAVQRYRACGLRVEIVSYRTSDPRFRHLLTP
jgi:hypothetical protein